ncbi:MAG TPA: MlaD family protein [Alphaproteobacteria bacterium]|nr:MlaD family protein [Alphaproteobacteria bacterium]
METRANHILIGAFTLSVVLAAMGFVLWLSKTTANGSYYDVKFIGSVSGLPEAGEVRYNGVKVGTVQRISFVPKEPDAVIVRIKVEQRSDFAVRKDSLVSLQLTGITGITYVQIAGGTLKSPKLPIVTDPKSTNVPLIEAHGSAMDQLMNSIPALVAKATITFDRLNGILNADNQAKVDRILTNLEAGSKDFASAIKSLNKLSTDADGFMTSDARKLVEELTRAAKSMGDAADLGDQVLAENRAAINNFTTEGLSQLATFVVEARQLVATIDRIAQHVESDPAGFVLGGSRGQEIRVGK